MTKDEHMKKLKETHTLYNDINSNVRIWVSKTKKINYYELYKIIAIANIKIVEESK